MNPAKLLKRLGGGSLKNVAFTDFASLLLALGFQEARVRGSHHIFRRPGVPELVNLQEVAGEAKPYQIRQVLRLVERYNLMLRDATGGEP